MSEKQTHSFQAEVSQLLNLMIHSLYSNKDIFLRELVSNGSDACEKRRFVELTDDTSQSDEELAIWIDVDKDNKQIQIRDSGIGMTLDEVVENLGTIARSGTRRFLESIKEDDNAKDQQLIGQFGVGFYSAFMVADEVIVETRSANSDKGVRWISNGTDSYSLEEIDKDDVGTTITLKLREDALTYADDWKIRQIVSTYSDHIAIPIYLKDEEGNYQAINSGTALWTRNKNDISDEEYQAFYSSLSHDSEPPLSVLHNKVEGNLEYTSLLFIPQKAPFDLWERDRQHGIKLYIQRVFIMDDASELLPPYLRFVKGVVDCQDLPLNVSREILQESATIRKIKSALTKRVLTELERIAKDEPEKYQGFWDEFGKVMKEGLVEDFENREQLLELMRFATLKSGSDAQTVSLADYVSGFQEKQDKIYYLTAQNYPVAINSPQLEALKKYNLDVLLLTDPVDEWVVGHVNQYQEYPFNAVNKGQVDLTAFGETKKDEQKDDAANNNDDNTAVNSVIDKMKSALSDRVKDVRTTNRLTESPACVVSDDGDLGANLERILKQMGQEAPTSKPILEINAEHPIIIRLTENDAEVEDWANVLLDQASIAEGVMPNDPAAYIKRVHKLLTA